MKTDALFGGALATLVLSLLLILASVHIYCETAPFVAMLGAIGAVLATLFYRYRAAGRLARGFGIAIGAVAALLDLAWAAYMANLCRTGH